MAAGGLRRCLVEDGLIVETTSRVPRDGDDRRRYYELTGEGRRVALEEVARLQALVRRVAVHLPGAAR